MDHRGAGQCPQPNQKMCANTTVDLRVSTVQGRRVANLPAHDKCDHNRDVCQYGERQKDSFHSKIPVTEGCPAKIEATTSCKE